MERIDIGDVLSQTFRIFFVDFFKLITMALIVYTPYMVAHVLLPSQVDEFGFQQEHPVSLLLSIFLGPILSIAAIHAAIQRLRGESATIGESLIVGFWRLFPVLVVNFLVVLAIVAGSFLLIVPGIIFAVMYSVAMPVCVVEKPGIMASMGRSQELTAGNRWHVFAVGTCIGILTVGISLLSLLFLSVGGAALLAVTLASTFVSTTLQAVFSGVLYHRLRRAKEGLAADEVARVFA